MALKTLLVCLMNREHADAVLAAAVPLARAHGAHLVGLHTKEALLVYPGIAMHVPNTAYHAIRQSQREQAEAIEAIFRSHTQREEFPSEWRLLQAESESAADRMIECAHAADLVVMPKDDPEVTRGDQYDAQARVIREGGRPVLVVPPDYGGGVLGQRVVLGWADTREAARAAHDLLALTAPGSQVNILRVDRDDRDELADHDAIDLAAMYDRHGLEARVVHRRPAGRGPAQALLNHAEEHEADLLVTGAFGHSRAYDFLFGGVTDYLLKNAELPVLFSA